MKNKNTQPEIYTRIEERKDYDVEHTLKIFGRFHIEKIVKTIPKK